MLYYAPTHTRILLLSFIVIIYSNIFLYACYVRTRFDLARKHTLFIVNILLALGTRKQNKIATPHFLLGP